MKIGVDGRKIPQARERGPIGTLEHAHSLGLEGVFFRTVFEMSPGLDPAELRAVRQRANELSLYLETGLGKVNPFATPEMPELRAAGDGDILLGFRRMMELCAEIGCVELWVATANYQAQYSGRFRYDRFRTDVRWEDQLEATGRLLESLAPMARDLGLHLNLETHEEITSFEVVRLVERVGPDAMGIVFDTANVLQRAEDPTRAARRVAPYVRQTHLKDALLQRDGDTIRFQLRPCGTGVVGFGQIVPVILASRPEMNLTIENAQSDEDRSGPTPHMTIDIEDPQWQAAHPDLDPDEIEAFKALVLEYEDRIGSGEVVDYHAYRQEPFGYDETIRYILDSAGHIRDCAGTGGPGEPT